MARLQAHEGAHGGADWHDQHVGAGAPVPLLQGNSVGLYIFIKSPSGIYVMQITILRGGDMAAALVKNEKEGR